MTRLTAQADALSTLIADRWPSGTEARLVGDLIARLPRTIAQMAMVTPDGFPVSVVGAPDRATGGGSSSPDRLAALVAQREAPTEDYRQLSRLVSSAAASVVVADRQGVRRAISDALAVTDAWQPPATVDERRAMMCVKYTESDSGVDEWVDPLCERIADLGRRGLCETCWRRRHRWQQRRAEAKAR
jgi:hypothetical protein